MVRETPWKQFFDAHAPHYDENPFTKHTAAEIDFLLKTFALSPGSKVLDVGCGTGRHSIELAKRGFQVTGVDFSSGMLEQAYQKAIEAGVQVNFVEADARSFELGTEFDQAICLCEGGVGLAETGEDARQHDLSIFRQVVRHLRPNGGFLLTCLNGYSVIRQMKDEFIAEGRFDPATMVSRYVDEWTLPEGTKVIQMNERLFIAPEMKLMLEESGFLVDAIYGGTAGHWAPRPLSLDEVEMMLVCRRA